MVDNFGADTQTGCTAIRGLNQKNQRSGKMQA